MKAVDLLARKLGEIVGREYCIVTASGTVALIVSLRALGVSERDEVILPSIVCPSVLVAVLATGSAPVFCDVSHCDLNAGCGSVRAVITARTRVVIAVHSFGEPCEIDPICSLARQHGCIVVEDFAQGFGKEVGGRPLGSSGFVSITSFGREKLLDAGFGGALFTDDAALYRESLRVLESMKGGKPPLGCPLCRRLCLACISLFRGPTLRRRLTRQVARCWGPPSTLSLRTCETEQILDLLKRKEEYFEARRARLREVLRATRHLPGLNVLAKDGSVLTMATFVLPRRPALLRRLLARSNGLFFLYPALDVVYDGPNLPWSTRLDGRLANISLSPRRDNRYLVSAISALLSCIGALDV